MAPAQHAPPDAEPEEAGEAGVDKPRLRFAKQAPVQAAARDVGHLSFMLSHDKAAAKTEVTLAALEAALAATTSDRELVVTLHRCCLAGCPTAAMLVPLADVVAKLPKKNKDERKLLRVAYYLLCRCFAAHASTLPTATATRLVSAWTAAVGTGAPDGDTAAAGLVHHALAALASATAGGVHPAGGALALCARSLLPGAQLLRKKGGLFGGASEVSGQPARDDGSHGPVVAVHRSVFGAARRSQEVPPAWGRGGGDSAGSALSSGNLMQGLCSADAIAARHAMACAVVAAAQRPADAAAALSQLVIAALAVPPLSRSDLMPPGAAAPGKSSKSHAGPDSLKAQRASLNLDDAECRCHFAALCCLLAHRRQDGMVTGTGERVFSDALVALLRDRTERVALIAVRGLCADLSVDIEESARSKHAVEAVPTDAVATCRARASAWLALAGEPRATCLRLVDAALRGPAPGVAAGLRAATALARCRCSALVAGLARNDGGLDPDGERLSAMLASGEARVKRMAAQGVGAPAWGVWQGAVWQHDVGSAAPLIDDIIAGETFTAREWRNPAAVAPLLRAMAQRCAIQVEAVPCMLRSAMSLAAALPVTTLAHASLGGCPHEGGFATLWAAVGLHSGGDASIAAHLRHALAATLAILRRMPATGCTPHEAGAAVARVEQATLVCIARLATLPTAVDVQPRDAQSLLHALHRSCLSGAPHVRVAAARALATLALRSPPKVRPIAAALLLSFGGSGLGIDDICGAFAALMRAFAAAASRFDAAVASGSDAYAVQDMAADLHSQCVAAAAKALRLPGEPTVCWPLGDASEAVLAAWAARTGRHIAGAPVATVPSHAPSYAPQQQQPHVQQQHESAFLPAAVDDPFGVAPAHIRSAEEVVHHADHQILFEDFSAPNTPTESPLRGTASQPRSMDAFDELPSFSVHQPEADPQATANAWASPFGDAGAAPPPPPSMGPFSDPFAAGPSGGIATSGAVVDGMRFTAPSSFAFDETQQHARAAPHEETAAAHAWDDPFAAPPPPPPAAAAALSMADPFFDAGSSLDAAAPMPAPAPPPADDDPFAAPFAPAAKRLSDPFADFGGGGIVAAPVAPSAFDSSPFGSSPDPFADVGAPPVAAMHGQTQHEDPFSAGPSAPQARAALPPDVFGDPFSSGAPPAATASHFDAFGSVAAATHDMHGDPEDEGEDEAHSDAGSSEASEEMDFDADVLAKAEEVQRSIMAKFAANKAAREAAALAGASPAGSPSPAPLPPQAPPPGSAVRHLAFDASDPFADPFGAAPPPPPPAIPPQSAPPTAAAFDFGDPFASIAPPAAPQTIAAVLSSSAAPSMSPMDDFFAPAPSTASSVPMADPFAAVSFAPSPPPHMPQQASDPFGSPAQEDEEEGDDEEQSDGGSSQMSEEMDFDANVLAKAEEVQRSIMAKFAANKAARDAAAGGSPAMAVAPQPPPLQPEDSAARNLAFEDPFASLGAPAAPQMTALPTSPAVQMDIAFGSPQDLVMPTTHSHAQPAAAAFDPFASAGPAPAAMDSDPFADPFSAAPPPPPPPPPVSPVFSEPAPAPPPQPVVVAAPMPPPQQPEKATSSVAARAAMFSAPPPDAGKGGPAFPKLKPTLPPVAVPAQPVQDDEAFAADSPAVVSEIKSFADRRKAFEAAAQATASGGNQPVVRVQPPKRTSSNVSTSSVAAEAAPAARDSFAFGGDAPKPQAQQPQDAPQVSEPPPASVSRRASLLAEMMKAPSHGDDSDEDASHQFGASSSTAFGSSAPIAAPPAMETASPAGPQVSMQRGLVLYDFTAEAEHELTVKAGDIVMVRFDDGVKLVTDGWVSCQPAAGGDLGLVPDSYVALK